MELKPNHTIEPKYNDRHHQNCKICPTQEYAVAVEIVQRSGLQADRWGFLIHDIASNLLGQGPYILTDGFVPDDWEGD